MQVKNRYLSPDIETDSRHLLEQKEDAKRLQLPEGSFAEILT